MGTFVYVYNSCTIVGRLQEEGWDTATQRGLAQGRNSTMDLWPLYKVLRKGGVEGQQISVRIGNMP